MFVIRCWIVLIFSVFWADGANILFLATVTSPSHHFWTSSISHALAAKGHNITYLSPDVDKKPVKNVHCIQIEGLYEGAYVDLMKAMFYTEHLAPYMEPLLLNDYAIPICEQILSSKGFRQLLSYPDDFKFDLIIYDYTLGPCCLPFLHKFNYPPLVSVTAYNNPAYTVQPAGGHNFYSYVPHNAFLHESDMTLWQRIYNFIIYIEDYYVRQYMQVPTVDKLGAKYFGFDFPSTKELERRTLVTLINTNPAMDYLAPLPENVIPVAGLHIKETKPLPKELAEFFSASKNGVVLFSLGTNMRSEYMPIEKQKMFIEVFSEISEYDFIWKFESNVTAAELPKNVKISPWLPQSDILAHPKLKAFITHSGLLSTQEAIWRGVPLIGIPLAFDQHLNILKTKLKGMAEEIDFHTITRDVLRNKLQKFLKNPKYTENAKKMSAQFRDQKEPPLDRAIWWIEWVLRNPNADYVKSPVLRLGYIVGNSIDVIAIVTTAILVFVVLLWKIVSFIVRTVRSFTAPQPNKGHGKAKKNN